MLNSEVDYSAVLADLKAKRDKLDAAITGIEAMLGLQTAADGITQVAGNGGRSEALGEGAFLGMSIVDATIKLLKAQRKAMRNDEIFQALKSGGLVFTSANPATTIGSILHRNWKGGGAIVRVSRGVWGLAEWHPRLRRKPGEGTATDDEETSESETA